MEKIRELFPNIDFESEIKGDEEFRQFVDLQCHKAYEQYKDYLQAPDAPKLNENYSNFVAISGLPQVEEAKYERLCGLVQKIITTKFNTEVKRFNMPMNDRTKTTYGAVFVEVNSEDDAKKLILQMDKFPLDKSHTCRAISFHDFENIMDVSDEFEAPTHLSLLDLKSWLTNTKDDQYLMKQSTAVRIFWNNLSREKGTAQKAVLDINSDNKIITDKKTKWSPSGTYLLVYQKNGVKVHGGSAFNKISEILHSNLTEAGFSPNEKRILTYSAKPKEGEKHFAVWNFETGELLRDFEAKEGDTWENTYKWSHDGEFIARRIENAISVYETEGMNMITEPVTGKKTSVKALGVQEFEWNPSTNTLAYWTLPEEGQQASIIGFIEIPTRKDIGKKTILGAVDIRLYWQKNGEFLAANIKQKKGGKAAKSSLEIYSIKTASIPTAQLMYNKEEIISLDWDTTSNTFAVLVRNIKKMTDKISRQELNSEKSVALIYEVHREGGLLVLKDIGKTDERVVSRISWSPAGSHFIMANMKSGSSANQGLVAFYFLKDKTFKLIATLDFTYANYLEWDPTGRYLICAACMDYTTEKLSSFFAIVSAQGVQLSKSDVHDLKYITWRPRPEKILGQKEREEVTKNLGEYAKRYKNEDTKVKAEKRATKEKLKAEFLEYLLPKLDEYKKDEKERKKLLGRPERFEEISQ